jgi:hypothetical protein
MDIGSLERAIHRSTDYLEFVPARALNLFDWGGKRLLLLLGFDAGGLGCGGRALWDDDGPGPTTGVS